MDTQRLHAIHRDVSKGRASQSFTAYEQTVPRLAFLLSLTLAS